MLIVGLSHEPGPMDRVFKIIVGLYVRQGFFVADEVVVTFDFELSEQLLSILMTQSDTLHLEQFLQGLPWHSPSFLCQKVTSVSN